MHLGKRSPQRRALGLGATFCFAALTLGSCGGGGGGGADAGGDAPPGAGTQPLVMTTPYASSADMAAVREAFSPTTPGPWGFTHNGIDFTAAGALKPFQAAFAGVVEFVELMQNGATGNWQVNLRLRYDATYAAEYVFEPFSSSLTDGQAQLGQMQVTAGQVVPAGHLLGALVTVGAGAHVHFGLRENGIDVCPEPFLSTEAKASILTLIHQDHPTWNLCY